MADDIDDLLDEVETKFCTKDKKKKASVSRCFPIYVGNTSLALGRSNSMNKKGCDKLRCTACDFKVITFDNFEWDPETDYLFLRNNVPDFHRLKSNLLPKKGLSSLLLPMLSQIFI
ncbi:hypothetical protein KUTeg_019532 [Tegillarca granosa]|uniref:Cilia- and flagella-associated protein 418 n=1 Tax=Tegillarca granosa TaxID=220873 RepID=A0ABQ9EFB7_TEGGR|nr:hypothetical protein KUTeg_019532 [Tegillarca granosa]